MISIVALSSSHYEEAADLWVASWTQEMPHLDFAARHNWLIGHLRTLASEGVCLLGAYCEERLVGFVTIDLKTGYLDQIVVANETKGQGIAAALLNSARSLSPLRIDLDVNEHNPRARGFYEKQGFVVVGAASSPRTGLPVLKLRWTCDPAVQQACQQP